MFLRVLVFITLSMFLLAGCKKNETQTGTLQINLSYKVDNRALQFDTVAYTCDAGYTYEVTRLNYYLSNFVFTKSDGSQYQSDKVFYVDASQVAENTLMFGNFAAGNCTGVNFVLGLDSAHNISDLLPATTENINMLWPGIMGDGYHFMKLEGHYNDTSGTVGFAMHLGRNNNRVHIQINRSINITGNSTTNTNLIMNINEWFRNPALYDFKTDGSYSMSNDSAMHKLCTNGTDIFN